jgi:hypothetical protein
MPARGVLCRLAVGVPKTSTHDLPRLTRLLQSSLLPRNALSLPAARALSRLYKASLAESRRSYATTSATTRTAPATKPTTRVKKDVKKTAAKKPAKKKKTTTTAKKSAKTPAKKTAKKPVAKRAKPKKKAAAKPRAKPRRRAVTPEAKKKAEIQQLKATALRAPTSPISVNAWAVFASEALVAKDGGATTTQRLKDAGSRFKQLTPAEKEASHSCQVLAVTNSVFVAL